MPSVRFDWKKAVLAAGLISGLALPARAEEVTLLHAGTLLAVPGQAPRRNATVVVRDGRIAEVRDGFARPADVGAPDARVIDLSRSFVLPGLIDSHVHLMSQLSPSARLEAAIDDPQDQVLTGVKHADLTLQAGFTTVRDLGSPGRTGAALRDAIRAGKVAGPTIIPAGAGLSATGGHGDVNGFNEPITAALRRVSVCDGSEACRKAVREQVKRGAEVIKLATTGGVLSEIAAGTGQQMFDDEIRAIVDAAHMLGKKVAAHAHDAAGINAALRNGVDSVEHASFLDDESIRLFRQKKAWLVPTLTAGAAVVDMAQKPGAMSEAIRQKALQVGPVMEASFARAVKGGVRVAFGTDSGVGRHGENARELQLMVRAGLSPQEAIRAATVGAADLAGRLDRIGTLEPGKDADIIAVSGNPLEDVTELRARHLRHAPGHRAQARRPPAGFGHSRPAEDVHPPRRDPARRARIPPRSQVSVIVRDGKIAEVRDGYVQPAEIGEPDAPVIDLRRAFVLPGLIDMHVHITEQLSPNRLLEQVVNDPEDIVLDGVVYASRTLQAGFTTVRDVNSQWGAALTLRDAVNSGKVPGPTILAVGSGLTMTAGHGDIVGYNEELTQTLKRTATCDSVDSCRKAVREQVKRGADAIKLATTGGVLSEIAAGTDRQMFDDEIRAIVETAHLLGKKVSSHAHAAAGVQAALRGGVDSIEHGSFLDEEAIRLFKEKDAWLVPTLLAGVTVAEMAKVPGAMSPAVREKALHVGPQHRANFRQAVKAGVRIAFGSDTSVSPHGQNAREFKLLVEAGLTPMEAIRAATVHAAELAGRSARIGTIEVGKDADIVAVAASPLEDVTELERVTFVMRQGAVHRLDGQPQ